MHGISVTSGYNRRPYMLYNRKKLQFITLLTAICIVSHIENSKNDKGYIT